MKTLNQLSDKKISGFLSLLLICLFYFSLSLGETHVDAIKGIIDFLHGTISVEAMVVGDIRLPRSLLAILVGFALGMSGAALQGVLRNPLADPSLVGASQGAALGAAYVFYYGGLGFLGIYALTVAGLMGAGVALMLMLILAGNAQVYKIILAGLAISTIAGALLATALNFAPNPYAMQELVFWLMGSVSNKGLDQVAAVLPFIVAGCVILGFQARGIYGLSLGEETAMSLGFNVVRITRRVILGCALVVGACVSVAGTIGFVGLIVPHLLRPFVGNRPDRLLIPSALLGSCLVLAADMLVRLLPLGRELKLGVLTSIIGAPFLIALVWKESKKWR